MAYLLTRNREQDFCARIRLPAGPAVVGRSSKSTIRIEDRSVSKVHATIEPLADGRFRVEDMGSRNGVVHAGRRRKRVVVEVGEEVRLGEVVVTFCGDGAETMPIPERVPRPTPSDFETSLERDSQAPTASGLWTRSERWALVLFGAVALALGAGVWWLSRPAAPDDAATVAGNPSGSESSSASEPVAEVVPSLEPLLALPPERIRRLRRVWLGMYGRIPSRGELRAAQSQKIDDLLLAARSSDEFWRWRAWCNIGHAALDEEILCAAPTDLPQWLALLRKVGAAEWPGDAAPLPDNSGDDRAYRGWLLQLLDDPEKPMGAATFARSVWTAARDSAPSLAADRVLLRRFGGGLPPLGARGLTRTLVHAPDVLGVRVPTNAAWVQEVLYWLLARKVPIAYAEELAAKIADTPRVLIEEIVLSREFGAAPAARIAQVMPQGRKAGGVRIDAWCDFPVRQLLRDPAAVPRLWARLSSALVQIYPVDTVWADVATTRQNSLPARWSPGEVCVFDRAPQTDVGAGTIRIVDGVFTPELRAVASLVGDPAVPALTDKVRQQLRESLTLRSVDDDWLAWRDRLRLGGYRLLGGHAEGAVHTPAARAILATQAEFDANRQQIAHTAAYVGVTIRQSPGQPERSWEDFMAALELLAVRFPDVPYDLWLWGSPDPHDAARTGATSVTQGVQTVRVRWGGSVERGRVVHETLPARQQHPALRNWQPARPPKEDSPTAGTSVAAEGQQK
ncbi:MAG: FHA domain-containing protein [Planctomycetota bacterium]